MGINILPELRTMLAIAAKLSDRGRVSSKEPIPILLLIENIPRQHRIKIKIYLFVRSKEF